MVGQTHHVTYQLSLAREPPRILRTADGRLRALSEADDEHETGREAPLSDDSPPQGGPSVTDTQPAVSVAGTPAAANPSYVLVECTRCGAGMRLDPKSAGMSCTGCGSTDYFYNCPPCKTPIRVAQSLVGKKVKCPKCDKSTDWGKWAKSQSSANAFATHPDESFFLDDHDRRVVGGTIIVQTGFSPFSDGSTCTLEFGKDRVSIIAPANGSGPRPRPIQLSYAEVTGLEIGGVGRTQTTVKARSGRLRETLVEGTLIATGLHETLGGFLVEAVTDATGEKSKTTTSVETKVTLSAGPASLSFSTEA